MERLTLLTLSEGLPVHYQGFNGVPCPSVLVRIWIMCWRDMLALKFQYLKVFSRPSVYFQLVNDPTVQM